MTVAITRVLAAFVGFILLLLGVGMLIFPELLASALFAVSARAVGTSALRSDFGALFLGMGGFCLVGVFSRFRWLLLVPSVFLLLVIVGRVISALVDKFSAWPIEILAAELLFLVVLLLAVLSYSRSSKDRTRPPELGILFSRGFLVPVAIVVVMVAGALNMRPAIGTALFNTFVDNLMARSDIDDLSDGLHIILAGTGSPMPDPARTGVSTVVIAGDHQFVVDSGPGSTLNLEIMKVPLEETDAVLLTHMHSDHIAGLGELLLKAWTTGARTEPLRIMGPQGVQAVVDGFNQAFSLDAGFRHAHHGDAVAPTSGAGGQAETIQDFDEDKGTVVFETADLTVTAFLVDHRPVEPSLAFRFDYRGRPAVISGDTIPTDTMRHHAEGVDLLVHEAMQPKMLSAIKRASTKTGQAVVGHVVTDIQSYHTFPEQAARIANDADVGHLVLYHIIPPLPFSILEPAFLGDSRKIFSGPITVAQDGMLFSLLPDTDDIDKAWLLR